MKRTRRILTLSLCLVLLLSFALVAHAASSYTHFSQMNQGFRVVGNATKGTNGGSATISASTVTGVAHIDPSEVTTSVSIIAIDVNGAYGTVGSNTGKLTCTATSTCSAATSKITCTYNFMGVVYGPYTS